MVGGDGDTTAFNGDGEIKEDDLLGKIVDLPFKDTKVIHILLEPLPVMTILPMATLITYPSSKYVINKAIEPLPMEVYLVVWEKMCLLMTSKVESDPHDGGWGTYCLPQKP